MVLKVTDSKAELEKRVCNEKILECHIGGMSDDGI